MQIFILFDGIHDDCSAWDKPKTITTCPSLPPVLTRQHPKWAFHCRNMFIRGVTQSYYPVCTVSTDIQTTITFDHLRWHWNMSESDGYETRFEVIQSIFYIISKLILIILNGPWIYRYPLKWPISADSVFWFDQVLTLRRRRRQILGDLFRAHYLFISKKCGCIPVTPLMYKHENRKISLTC